MLKKTLIFLRILEKGFLLFFGTPLGPRERLGGLKNYYCYHYYYSTYGDGSAGASCGEKRKHTRDPDQIIKERQVAFFLYFRNKVANFKTPLIRGVWRALAKQGHLVVICFDAGAFWLQIQGRLLGGCNLPSEQG